MNFFSFIVWTASPEILTIGSFSIRWYGLLFALGFLIGQQILIWIYKQEGKNEKDLETLTIYMLISTVVGARLGHCLFYQPDVYLKDPIQILYIWEGGLASHGATVGILLAIYIYSKKVTGQSYLYVLDRVAMIVVLAGCLIRIGNLMNSEIIGKPTNEPWGFVFARSAEENIGAVFGDYIADTKISNAHKEIDVNGRKLALLNFEVEAKDKKFTPSALEKVVDIGIRENLNNPSNSEIREHIVVPEDLNIHSKINEDGYATASFQVLGVPRHPAQVYEAISCLILFILLFAMYLQKKGETPEGRIFGIFITILFTLRFCYEFLKEPQVEFEQTMSLNMGQLLSIPMIVIGVYVLMKSYRKKGEIS